MNTLLPATVDITTMPRADIPAIFDGFKQQLDSLVDTATTLTVTDASQKELIALAHSTRMTLRVIRLDIEKKRKELTEYHLKTKQHVDACAKWLREQIEPLEARLEDQEKFAARQEAARRETLRNERVSLLAPFGVDVALYRLEDMDVKAFNDLYDVSKYSYEEAQARAKEQAEEQARMREENERLRKEALAATREREALEAKALAERREAEAKLNYERQQAEASRQRIAEEEKRKQDALIAERRAEQQKREAAERELQAARDKEARILAEQKLAAEKAAQAPDREKLMAFAAMLKTLAFPVATTEAGKEAFKKCHSSLFDLAHWIESDASKL